MNEIKILHVFGRMQRGGAEMRTLDVMRNIDRTKYKFYFCSLSGQEGELDDEIRKLGGEVYYCRYKDPLFPVNFRRLLKENKFDIVHSHVHTFSGLIVFLAKMSGIPKRIVHFRNTHDGMNSGILKRLQRKVMKLLIKYCSTHILAVSKGAMELAYGSEWKQDHRCKVIYNGIDIQQPDDQDFATDIHDEFGIEPNAPIIINVGRMVVQKNQVRVIEIFHQINQKLPDSKLLIVGMKNDGIEAKLKEKIRELRLDDKVIITGVRSDVPRLMSKASILLFPSLWEGLPGVVLEASALGVPTLGSDLPGIREIANHISTVYTLQLDDPNETWADKAVRIIDRYRTVDKSNLIHEFNQSIFNIHQCTNELMKIWS